jgi:hypothetical protein
MAGAERRGHARVVNVRYKISGLGVPIFAFANHTQATGPRWYGYFRNCGKHPQASGTEAVRTFREKCGRWARPNLSQTIQPIPALSEDVAIYTLLPCQTLGSIGDLVSNMSTPWKKRQATLRVP